MDQEEDIDIEERQVILDVITELLAIQLEELLNIVIVGHQEEDKYRIILKKYIFI